MVSVRASVVLFFMHQKQSEKLGREDDLTNSKLIVAIDKRETLKCFATVTNGKCEVDCNSPLAWQLLHTLLFRITTYEPRGL
jgi:hypothetical protein